MTIQSFGFVPLALVQERKEELLGTGNLPTQSNSNTLFAILTINILVWIIRRLPAAPISTLSAPLLVLSSFEAISLCPAGVASQVQHIDQLPLCFLSLEGQEISFPGALKNCLRNLFVLSPTLDAAVLARLPLLTLQHFPGSASNKNIFMLLFLFCYLPLTTFSKVF